MMHKLFEEFRGLIEAEDKERAVSWAMEKIKSGSLKVVELYTKILAPALNGVDWCNEDDRICIWKEHVRTSIVRTILELCYPVVLRERDDRCGGKIEKCVLVLCPPNEYHEIGAKMVADFFTIAGFNTVYIGANTPKKAVIAAIELNKPDYIAISVSNPYHVLSIQSIIKAIRTNPDIPPLKVIVGGSAIKSVPELYKTIGADYHMETFDDICNLKKGKVEGE